MWAEICVLFRVSILASLVLVLLLNTSAQFTLLRIICLVSTVVTPLVSFDTQPIGDQHEEQQHQESSPPSGVLGSGRSRLVRPRGGPF